MNKAKRELRGLFEVQTIVEPRFECDKIGITTLELGDGEAITIQEHLEDKTELCVTVNSDDTKVNTRVQFLMKAFLAPFELDSKRSFSVETGVAHLINHQSKARLATLTVRTSAAPAPKPKQIPIKIKLEPGYNVLNVTLHPIPPKFEDIDFTFAKKIAGSIKTFDMPRKDRILQALNFLHDALAAPINVQSYLLIYGGLNYLTSIAGQQRNTLLSDAMTLFKLIKSGILDADGALTWMEKFQYFHGTHYDVLKSNTVDKQELDEIKAFFKEFLTKYIEAASFLIK